MNDRRGALRDELTRRVAPAVLDEVSLALGVTEVGHWPPVACYHLEISEQLLTLTACVPGRLVRLEMAADGRLLHVTVPWARVARIAEAVETATVTVVVELDADRRAVTLGGIDRGSDPAEREVRLEGALLPSAFVLSGAGPEVPALREVARVLRAAMSGDQ
jgi:hypothetical protein